MTQNLAQRNFILQSATTFHCVKSVCIQSFSSPYSARMRENTDQKNFEYGHLLQSGVTLYPFQASIPFLYSLKTLENFRFSAILWSNGNEKLA